MIWVFNQTTIQQPLNVGLIENAQILDEEIDSESQKFIQHSTKDRGERGGVEQKQFDSILQNEQISNFSSTQKDASCKRNSQASTREQKAFQQKYQPVEVLNRDGEWISGYSVHKCLVVANLERVERKYALVDRWEANMLLWVKFACRGWVEM